MTEITTIGGHQPPIVNHRDTQPSSDIAFLPLVKKKKIELAFSRLIVAQSERETLAALKKPASSEENGSQSQSLNVVSRQTFVSNDTNARESPNLVALRLMFALNALNERESPNLVALCENIDMNETLIGIGNHLVVIPTNWRDIPGQPSISRDQSLHHPSSFAKSPSRSSFKKRPGHLSSFLLLLLRQHPRRNPNIRSFSVPKSSKWTIQKAWSPVVNHSEMMITTMNEGLARYRPGPTMISTKNSTAAVVEK